PKALAAQDAHALAAQDATLLDIRPAADFGHGHPRGSVNIGLGGQFAAWAGTLLDPSLPIILVADEEEAAREAVMRLSRVGLERVAGFVVPRAWSAEGLPTGVVPQISVEALGGSLSSFVVVDVRRPTEYASGHVPGAVNIPLHRLTLGAAALDPARPTAVICAGGYRSSAGASLLEGRGFTQLRNVEGGTSAWIASGQAVQIPEPSLPPSGPTIAA
ncbi:MAG TPA: rhodanese-like domain-containing protein, partial [Vicinamibacteria bacterium]|nr:rhodanese-like domain-containing protein [Vicinamibacteria bacterium]